MSHRPTDTAAERELLSLAGKARTPSGAPSFSRRSSRLASARRGSPNGRLTVAVAQIGRHSKRTALVRPGTSELPRVSPGQFRKLDAVAVLTARLLPAPENGRSARGYRLVLCVCLDRFLVR